MAAAAILRLFKFSLMAYRETIPRTKLIVTFHPYARVSFGTALLRIAAFKAIGSTTEVAVAGLLLCAAQFKTQWPISGELMRHARKTRFHYRTHESNLSTLDSQSSSTGALVA